MIEKLPNSPEAAHQALVDKINEHTRELAKIHEEDRLQNAELAEIKTDVKEIKEDTKGLVEIFRAGDGTLKTLKWFGKALAWIGGIASAIYGIIFAISNWPHKGS